MWNVRRVAVAVCAVTSAAEFASAQFLPFAGDESAHVLFENAAGSGLGLEDFDSYSDGANVASLPGLHVSFDDPLPFAQAYEASHIFARSEPNQLANRPPDSDVNNPYIIRPEPGLLISALGLWETSSTPAGIDQLRLTAFDGNGLILGSVDTPFAGVAFAGFVVSSGASRVEISVLGNADGRNGFDDLQIGTVPEPATVSLLVVAAGIIALRRRR
ncbi:hypothetical protein RAS1_16780 [Phycisphaerae bacterium RAS1]|nr:hypothetical protein RAS1_16780 [Phycisphaerae bacterium RAS1]